MDGLNAERTAQDMAGPWYDDDVSSEEQDAMRGKALRELQAAKADLHCLKNKAQAMGLALHRVADLLQLGQFEYPQIAECPERQDVVGVAHGMITANSRIGELEADLEGMGTPVPR